ncbi:hypothetical protein F9Z53_22510, partial [Escherichia coli]
MAKRKNNVVKKIGDSASLLSKPKSILRRKDFKELVTLTKQNSAPGEWKTERHCCKVSDEAAFCLIQRPYISKTLLTRRI